MEDNQPVEKVNATPVQTTNVAEAQPVVKKKSKAPIIILVVILVLVLCCGGSALAFYFASEKVVDETKIDIEKSLNESIEEIESEISDISGLSKVETDEYVFYYPKEYAKVEMAGVLMQYQSSKLNDKSGYNSINVTSDTKDLVVVSDTQCSSFADTLKEAYATMFGSEVRVPFAQSFSDYNDQEGCQINFVIDRLDINIDQRVFVKDGANKLYIVTVGYDNQESEDYTILHTAQETFIIK